MSSFCSLSVSSSPSVYFDSLSAEKESKEIVSSEGIAKSSFEEYKLAIINVRDMQLRSIEERLIKHEEAENDLINSSPKKEGFLKKCWKKIFQSSLDFQEQARIDIITQIGAQCKDFILESDWKSDQELGFTTPPLQDIYFSGFHQRLDLNIALNLLNARKSSFERFNNPDFCNFIADKCKFDAQVILKQPNLSDEERSLLSHCKKLNSLVLDSPEAKELIQLMTDRGQGALFLNEEKRVSVGIETLDKMNILPLSIIMSIILPYMKR